MIRFLVFGTLDLQVDAGVDTRALLAQSKHIALLGCLAIGNGGLHRREKLAAMLWPELDDARSRNALSKAVHNIRRTLGDDVLVLRGNDSVGINTERIWCDAAAFDRAIEKGEREEALEWYRRGEVLDGFSVDGSVAFEHWLDSVRLRVRMAAVKAAAGLASEAENAEDLAASVRWSRVASEMSPHDETVLRQLLVRLVQSGDRAGALSAYREFAERLNRELDAEPSQETSALAESLRAVRANGNGSGNGVVHGTGLKPQHADVEAVVSEEVGRSGSAEISSLVEAGVSARPQNPTLAGSGTEGSSKWRARTPMAIAAAAAIVATALLALPGSPFHAKSNAGSESPFVAVSPIRFDTGDSSLKTMANMATEGIVQQLVQSSPGVIDLRNIGKSGQDASGRSGDESRTQAREVGAGTLVGGRMYAKGDSVYANVQITDAKSGRVLHQLDQYASPASNPYLILGSMKEGVAGAIAALSDTLYLPWSRAHSRPPTFAAFGEFMQGLDAILHLGPKQAVKHFKAAIVLDTAFAEAKIWLLEQAVMLPEETKFADSVRLVAVAQRRGLGEFDRLSLDRVLAFLDGRWEDAYVASRRLVEIAPTTPDAHMYLAQSAMATRRYAEAIRAIRRIDETDNWLKTLGQHTAWNLQAHRLLGDLQGELSHWKRARARKPADAGMCMSGVVVLAALARETAVDSVITECMKLTKSLRAEDNAWWNAGRGFRSKGYTDAARRAFQRSIDLISASNAPEQSKKWLIGTRQVEMGEWKSAYANLRASFDSTDASARSVVAVAAANAGDTAFAMATLKWMEERDGRIRIRDRDVSERAFVHLALGRREQALVLLRQAMAEGRTPAWNGWFLRFELQPLQNDSRYQAMVRPVW